MHRSPSPPAAAAAAGGTRLRARRVGPDPAASRRHRSSAIDPPPDPIAFTSTIGTRTEYPLISPSARMSGCPRLIKAMSQLVPPMSTVIRSSIPAARPTSRPLMTPAAGPDRKSRTGRCRAMVEELMPPRDCMICSGVLNAVRRQILLHVLEIVVRPPA